MWKRLDALSKTIAVDVGTSTTRVWEKGRGLVGEYPSFLAVDTTSERILAVGKEAAEMAGRTAANVKVFRPIQNGQVWDADVAKAFLRFLLKDVAGKSFFSPTILLSMPASLKPAVENETVQLGYSLGAREVLMVAQPLAAAIGAGMPVADASGGFIFNLGAGVAEAGVISLGTLVSVESTRQAGEYFEQSIMAFLKESRSLIVSRETARVLLQKVACVQPSADRSLLVAGKDSNSGAPREGEITAADLALPVTEMTEGYVRSIQKLLTMIPTELTVDVVDKGLLLSGGGAQLAGLEELLVPQLGVPVSVVDDPERAVIRGMGTIADHLDEFRRSLGYEG